MFVLVLFTSLSNFSYSQFSDSIYFNGAIKENRIAFYDNAVKKSITDKLSLPLNAENEEDWSTAFEVMMVLNQRTPWLKNKIDEATLNIIQRSPDFQMNLLEVFHQLYPGKYKATIRQVIQKATDPKLFAMAGAALLINSSQTDSLLVKKELERLLKTNASNAILTGFKNEYFLSSKLFPDFSSLFSPDFLRGKMVVYSIQRQDRNYPGILLIRKPDGNFVKNADSSIFYTGQLARSISNMPGYITNGNTPQGIFRLSGFDRSRSYYIGPTPNLQLTLPGEYKASHFYFDTTLPEKDWALNKYLQLLPYSLRHYVPLQQAFWAGVAGRSAIIAHGTTIDPELYKGEPYYPFTPSNGCLVAEEWWNDKTGKLEKSGQLQIANALAPFGKPEGYFVVFNINNEKRPVLISEIERLLPQ